MPGFEEAFAVINKPRNGEPVSPELKPLLHDVYKQILARPRDLRSLKYNLQNLLQYLSADGHANANVCAVDLFFMNCEAWASDWADQGLPEEFHDILAKMGEALHDAVSASHIAENFANLPEQLLEELNRINLDHT